MTAVRVMSRDKAEKFKTDVSHIVISITDPESETVNLLDQESRKDILRVSFWDLDRPFHIAGIEEGLFPLFSEDDAIKIKEFVDIHMDKVDLIVCHCEAGISRSAAVAAAITRIYVGDDSDFFKMYLPNRRVYRMILEAYYGRPFMAQG